MTRRMKLILTRPFDDSLEAFVNFRRGTTIKSAHNQKGLTKDDLVDEWEKFWEYIYTIPGRKICSGNYPN